MIDNRYYVELNKKYIKDRKKLFDILMKIFADKGSKFDKIKYDNSLDCKIKVGKENINSLFKIIEKLGFKENKIGTYSRRGMGEFRFVYAGNYVAVSVFSGLAFKKYENYNDFYDIISKMHTTVKILGKMT